VPTRTPARTPTRRHAGRAVRTAARAPTRALTEGPDADAGAGAARTDPDLRADAGLDVDARRAGLMRHDRPRALYDCRTFQPFKKGTPVL